MNNINKIKEELERMKKSEERLRLLFNVMPDIVCFMERALRKSRRLLINAQTMASIGSFEFYPERNQVVLSEGFLRLLGHGHGSLEIGLGEFLDFFCEPGRKQLKTAMDEVLGHAKGQGLDLRLRTKSAKAQEETLLVHCELMPSHVSGQAEPDEEPFVLGTVQDVTYLRFAERQLELASMIFEHSIEGITVTDKDGNIVLVNPAFTRITGYRPEEVLGKNPRILKSDRHGPEFYEKMWRDINEKGQWSGEIWNRRKDGQAYPEHLTITAVKDARGEVMNYVSLFYDLTELKEMKESLEFSAYHDALTKLPNRQLFKDRLHMLIRHAEAHSEQLAIILFDIDDFRLINEGIGYEVGDRILQEIAGRLTSSIQKNDIASRLGGDEFAACLEDIDSREKVFETAARLLDIMSRPYDVNGQRVRLTISMGITFFPDDGRDPDTLIKNAELAMYRSKELGKNALQIFTTKMDAKVRRNIRLQELLHQALERGEFKLYYQPKVDVVSEKITGFEALIRWFNEEEGHVSPAEFIPICEKSGLIIDIGQWVLNEVCRQYRQWQREGYEIDHIAVNLSPRQFRDKHLMEKILAALETHSVAPDALALEITEGVVMDDEENAIKVLHQLKEMGVRLAMDDFGTGYSSLYYLKQFPMDELKIDRSFIIGLPENHDSKAITTAIVFLAKGLGLKTVAEGAEQKSQVDFLRKLGCNMVQGFFYSPPLPPEELLKRCEKLF